VPDLIEGWTRRSRRMKKRDCAPPLRPSCPMMREKPDGHELIGHQLSWRPHCPGTARTRFVGPSSTLPSGPGCRIGRSI
jgi:hypothetical protein